MHLGAPVAGGGASSILIRKTCKGLMTTRGAETGRSRTDSTETAHKGFRGLGSLTGQKGTREDTESAPRVGTALQTGTRKFLCGKEGGVSPQ